MIDYLYVTLKDSKKDASFKLSYNDHVFANSTIEVESSDLQNNNRVYALEIKYRYNIINIERCKEFGGAFIDFDLEFNVPDCGRTHIFWKKICGNPFMPRYGFTMDIEYGNYNYTMVKNGLLINASYFDADLDNFVFSVPSTIKQTKFYLYIDPASNKNEPNFKDENIVQEILELAPDADMQEPKVDADQYILNPTLSGQLAKGGLISEQR
jgi:hypothetical protein